MWGLSLASPAALLSRVAMPIFDTGHHYGRSRYMAGHKPNRSIADQPHKNKRANTRRVRQANRVQQNRFDRAYRDNPEAATAAAENNDPYGITRRGRRVAL